MSISIEDMKSCIQEWFAQAYNFEDLADIFYAVESETKKQFVYMAEQIGNRNGMKSVIKDFATYYSMAKEKIKLKLWSVEYAKGFLYCYLEFVLDVSDDNYNEYTKLIDELE